LIPFASIDPHKGKLGLREARRLIAEHPALRGFKFHPNTQAFWPNERAHYPELKIILAHPSVPWQEEALAVATHKPNVYIDLSGWSPKYFPEILIRYINTLLRDKMLFGSDFPLITPERWLADFERLEIRDEVRPLVLKQNAARLLGL